MEASDGAAIAQVAVDAVRDASNVFGMLFPYCGLEKRAVDSYINEIEKADLDRETKAFLILTTRTTIKKLKNQSKIAKSAINNASQGTDFSEKSGVNEEWLERFMDSAAFVSDEEMQLIWGKILAMEFSQPGTTPPSMRRILSEITPELAEAFCKICGMQVRFLAYGDEGETEYKQLFVPFDSNAREFYKYGVGFEILNELENIGLIRFNAMTGYVSSDIKNEKVLVNIADCQQIEVRIHNNEFITGDVILTSAGEALSAIVTEKKWDGYVDCVSRYLSEKNVEYRIIK